jgi:bifunctional DNA-binding transcriptional regulator/antitoxin component of YhaV-PrlF toxin-antitoxin module
LETIVGKNGRIKIPLSIRKKYGITEKTRFLVTGTDVGILFKPINSIWDMVGLFSNYAVAEEIEKQLDKLRHEDDLRTNLSK